MPGSKGCPQRRIAVARYTDAKCRLCRREGIKLFLKGDRCNTEKCALERRAYPPGQHGQGRSKRSDYGVQLREKQKVRRAYGLLEKQFRLYFKKAERMKGVTGENLLSLLESRLDNVIYRTGFASSRSEARQVVRHRHVLVNGQVVNVPSFQVKPGSVIAITEKSKNHGLVTICVEAPLRDAPQWLEVDRKELKATMISAPAREDIDLPVQESLIVELYSK
jgi:small subunit ribosomal protein S4